MDKDRQDQIFFDASVERFHENIAKVVKDLRRAADDIERANKRFQVWVNNTGTFANKSLTPYSDHVAEVIRTLAWASANATSGNAVGNAATADVLYNQIRED